MDHPHIHPISHMWVAFLLMVLKVSMELVFMVQIKHDDLYKSCSTSNVHTGGITTLTDAGYKREGVKP